jgi:hypothetical protein
MFISWEKFDELFWKWGDTPEMRAAGASISVERDEDDVMLCIELINKPESMKILEGIVQKYQKPEDEDGYDLKEDVIEDGDLISTKLSDSMSKNVLAEILAGMPNGMIVEDLLAFHYGVVVMGEPLKMRM